MIAVENGVASVFDIGKVESSRRMKEVQLQFASIAKQDCT